MDKPTAPTENRPTEPPLNTPPPAKPRNALRDGNWEILVVTGVFVAWTLATLYMVLISVSDDTLRIVPAAGLLAMVELWLVFTIPLYSRLSFWGGLIFIATYLMFSVSFAFLNLLSGWAAFVINAFTVAAIVSVVLMVRQRHLYLPPPPKSSARPSK